MREMYTRRHDEGKRYREKQKVTKATNLDVNGLENILMSKLLRAIRNRDS